MKNILFCGDVCPGGVLAYQDKYVDNRLQNYLNSFDVRICTLEGAIGTNLAYESSKLSENGGNDNVCYARNEDFYRVKDLGFNVVSLANNHSFDLGEQGFINLLSILKANHILYCGAGFNIEEAARPAVIYDDDNSSIAVFAFCIEGTYPYSCNVAGVNTSGIYKDSFENILNKVQDYKSIYDVLILLPHWGQEHSFFPPAILKKYTKKLFAAGADAIFGSHSHTYSPYYKEREKISVYGMGNFLFPDFMMEVPRPMSYPENAEEVKDYKRVINYPKSITEPVVSVWDSSSRIGTIWNVSIKNKKISSVSFQFTILSKDNIIYLLKDFNQLKNAYLKFIKVKIGNIIMKFPQYSKIRSIITKF